MYPPTKEVSSSRPPKPVPVQRFENIPTELRAIGSWVNWKYIWKEKEQKWDKPPVTASGYPASTSDPSTWGSFEKVLAAYESGKFNLSGIGFRVTEDIIGIDFDACIDKAGVMDAKVLDAIRKLSSYTEISPSGTGVRVFVRGSVPSGGYRRGALEMYDKDSPRYLTVTGNIVSGFPTTIAERDLTELHAQMLAGAFPKKEKQRVNTPEPAKDSSLVLRNESDHSASGDEWHLLLDLVKEFGNDADKIEEEFRKRAKERPKWNERRGGMSYVRYNVERAIKESKDSSVHEHSEKAESEIPRRTADGWNFPPAWSPEEQHKWLAEIAIEETERAEIAAKAESKTIVVSSTEEFTRITKPQPEDIPPFDNSLLTGDLSDFARILTEGTSIPQHFVYFSAVTILGAALSGTLVDASRPSLHSNLYTFLIGERGRTSKTEARDRALEALVRYLPELRILYGINSGESLAREFEDLNKGHKTKVEEQPEEPEVGLFERNRRKPIVVGGTKNSPTRILIAADEWKTITDKMRIKNASLCAKFLELWKNARITHKVKDEDIELDNAHLAILTGCPPESFGALHMGTGADENGLLSREFVEYAPPFDLKQYRWFQPDLEKLQPVVERIIKRFKEAASIDVSPTQEAMEALDKFIQDRTERRQDARIDEIISKIGMVQALFNDGGHLSLKTAGFLMYVWERISLIRDVFYPQDALNPVERFEQEIKAWIDRQADAEFTANDIARGVHPERPGHGGMGCFDRALHNLVGYTIRPLGKTSKGTVVYGRMGE